MKTSIIKDNYANNYNLNQLALPLIVEQLVEKDDLVISFVEIMRKVRIEKFIKRSNGVGRTPYDPTMMLMVILFAYTNQIYSLRKIESALKYDTRFILLSNNQKPSFKTIGEFITKHLVSSVEDIFVDINQTLMEFDNIDTSILYFDGSKFEANAHKNSFVWKKAVIKFQEKLLRKIDDLVKVFNEHYDTNFPLKNEYKVKLEEYIIKLETCGNRNSYSKIDKDATFMNMKYDYYNNIVNMEYLIIISR